MCMAWPTVLCTPEKEKKKGKHFLCKLGFHKKPKKVKLYVMADLIVYTCQRCNEEVTECFP